MNRFLKLSLLSVFIILLTNTFSFATNISNGNIDDEDFADISDWTDADWGLAASTQVTFDSKSCLKMDSGTDLIDGRARRNQDVGTFGTFFVISISLYCDAIGTLANSDYFHIEISNGNLSLAVRFASDGLYVYDGAAYNEVGTDLVTQDTWQEWTFAVDDSDDTVDVYLGQVLQQAGVDCSNLAGDTNGNFYIMQYGYTTISRISYVDWEKAGDNFASSAIGQFIMISEN